MHRRTPLKRTGRLKRTAMKRKPKRRYRGDGPAARQAWCDEHESCAACGLHYRQFGVVLHLHHIVGGNRSRPDYAWNWLRLCVDCHDMMHGDPNRVAVSCYLKRETDVEHFDPETMQAWYRQFGREILPDVPDELPAWIWKARGEWTK